MHLLVAPSSLIAFFAYFLMGSFLLGNNRKNLSRILFSFWIFCFSFRNLGVYLMCLAPSPALAIQYSFIVNLSLPFIYAFFYHFAVVFSDTPRNKIKFHLWGAYFSALFFVFLIIQNQYWIDGVQLFPWGYTSKVAVGSKVFTLFFWYFVILGLGLLRKAYRNALGRYKQQIKFIYYGFLILYIASLTNFLMVFGINIVPMMNIISVPTVFAVFYSVLKFETFDIKIFFRKSFVFSMLAVVISSIYFFSVFLFNQFLFPLIGHHPVWVVLLSSVLLAVTYKPVTSALEQITDRLFYLKPLDLRGAVERITNELKQSLGDQKSIMDLVTQLLGDSFRLKFVYGYYERDYFVNQDYESFYGNSSGKDVSELREPLFKNRALLDEYFGNKEGACFFYSINYEILTERDHQKKEKLRQLRDFMEKFNLTAVLAFKQHDQKFRMVFLGKKLSGDDFNNQEIEVLRGLAAPIQIAIDNSELYKMGIENQKKIDQLEKMAILGSMGRGLAHEIKNPLTSIKTFFEVYPTLSETDKSQFSDLAKSQLKRVDALLERLRGYTQPQGLKLKPTLLRDLVSRIAVFLKPELNQSGVVLENLLDAQFSLDVDPDRFEQVLLNLIQNSIQGRDSAKPHSWIKVAYDAGSATLQVSDNGVGMNAEQLKNIFTPFYTTKKEGSGLGLSIVQNIIAAHGGQIHVESRMGQGTLFKIKI